MPPKLKRCDSIIACRRPVERLEGRALPSTGQLDTTFGAGGRVQTTILGSGDEEGNAAIVQSDGTLLVTGTGIGLVALRDLTRDDRNVEIAKELRGQFLRGAESDACLL